MRGKAQRTDEAGGLEEDEGEAQHNDDDDGTDHGGLKRAMSDQSRAFVVVALAPRLILAMTTGGRHSACPVLPCLVLSCPAPHPDAAQQKEKKQMQGPT